MLAMGMDGVNNAVIASLLCPSDPGAQGGAWNTAHTNSYNASYGATTTQLNTWGNNCNTSNFIGCVIPDQSSGVYTYGIAYGFQAITDGTSNTVAFAEKLCGQNGQNYYKTGTPPGQTYRGNMVSISGAPPAGATQVNLGYLPAPNTDFIFAVVGETYGFVGAAVVLSLYALMIWRSLRILTMAKNLYGTLIAGGVLAMLMFQVFINAGMTIGIMPITGVPLPLMSYGGSSVLVTFIAIGLLQSIYIQARMTAASKSRGLVS